MTPGAGWGPAASSKAEPGAPRARRLAQGFGIEGLTDQIVSFSLCLQAPDGNTVEIHVDKPGHDWQHDRDWPTAPVKPLHQDP